MEDIRPDEGAVLKTAGVNALRGSSPWSSALFEFHSPVAQRRRHLVYTQSIDGSSPSRTTFNMALIRLVRGVSAKHAATSSNLTSASFVHGPSVQPGVDAALSRQRSPVQIRYGSLRSLKFHTSHFTLRTSSGVVRQRLSGLFQKQVFVGSNPTCTTK